MKKENIVIGMGEVGQAISQVIEADAFDMDKEKESAAFEPHYKNLHICFPFSDQFEQAVKAYREKYTPELVVIHSTVPIGTSTKLDAVHSPIRGKHPNLRKSLMIFVKYFGGPNAPEAALIFSHLKTRVFKKSETTEALKLCSLLQYASSIVTQKQIFALCEQTGLDFAEVYTDGNTTYNEGYQELGGSHFTRPILEQVEGKIGGHCVAQNIGHLPLSIAQYILNFNEEC